MDNANSNDFYVGDGTIRLYTYEKDIKLRINSIMNSYAGDFNNKDFIKKSIELFHLLTYLDTSGELDNVNEVIPNEPGYFLVNLDGENILYEVVTVFGDKEAKSITDLVKEILNVKSESPDYKFEYPAMDTDKLTTQFKRILSQKKDKSYFLNYEHVMLLLVTSEHDRCGTSPWYLVEDMEEEVNDFIDSTDSSIKILNYFSSGRNGNPSTNDIKNEINLYNKSFNSK